MATHNDGGYGVDGGGDDVTNDNNNKDDDDDKPSISTVWTMMVALVILVM